MESTLRSKASGVTQNKRYSSNLRTSPFSKKQNWGSSVASQKMRLTNSSCPPIAQPLSLITRKRMGRGVCASGKNGVATHCPIRALGRRVVHLWQQGAAKSSFLSTFYHEGKKYDVIGEDVSKALKLAATLLEYPAKRGIPIELIDTYSLR